MPGVGGRLRGARGSSPRKGLRICGSKTSVLLGLRGTGRDPVPERPPFPAHHVGYGRPSPPPLRGSAGPP